MKRRGARRGLDPECLLQIGTFSVVCSCSSAVDEHEDIQVRDEGFDWLSICSQQLPAEAPPLDAEQRAEASTPLRRLRRPSFRERGDSTASLSLSLHGLSQPATPSQAGLRSVQLTPCAATSDAELRAQFEAAVAEGRLLDAHRAIQRLEQDHDDAGAILGDDLAVERVERLATLYDSSLSFLARAPEELYDHETEPALNLRWGVEVQGSNLKVLLRVTACDIDATRLFAALLERDLQRPISAGLLEAETLGAEHANDACWRSISYSKTTWSYSDNVVMLSSLDALDEESGCIWLSSYTPDQNTTDVQEIDVPPPRKDHSRSKYVFMAVAARPRPEGLEVTMGMDVRLPDLALPIVRSTPGFLLRSMARSRTLQYWKDLRQHALHSEALTQRMRDPKNVRAAMYSQLQSRLAQHHT